MNYLERKQYIIQPLILLFVCGCSATRDGDWELSQTDVGLDFRGSDCILIRTIRDYRPLDSSHMLISGPAKRTYFVALFRPAFDMRGSMGLTFDSRDEQLCPFGGDAIMFGGLAHERVTIQSISRVTAEQEQEILFRFGLLERAEKKPPEPANVKGAEVEELD
jgi:hypothetical protein